jgi:hypothetical protein
LQQEEGEGCGEDIALLTPAYMHSALPECVQLSPAN